MGRPRKGESEPLFPGFLAAVGQDIAGGDEMAEDETGTYTKTENGRVDHHIIHGNILGGMNSNEFSRLY